MRELFRSFSVFFFRVRFGTRFGMPFKMFFGHFWNLLEAFWDPWGTFGRLWVNFCNFLGVFLETPPKLAKSLPKVPPRPPKRIQKQSFLDKFDVLSTIFLFYLLLASIWLLLAPIGSYCLLLAPIGSYWLPLAPIGSYWLLLAPIGSY